MEFTQNHKQTNTGSRLAFLLLFLMSFGSLNAQLPNTLSNAEKVYGLSKFWQEVNYNFVYLNQVDREAWTKEYIDLIDEVQATENDYEYYRLLQKFCALLKDGHTNIFFPNSINNLLYRTNFGEYRLFVENFEGKAIITAVNLSKKEELPYSCLVGFKGRDGSLKLTSYDKSHLTFETTQLLKNKIFKSLIK